MRIFRIPIDIISFLGFYLYNLVKSNLIIAADILSPRLNNDPVLVEAPIIIQSQFGLLLFSNLLSMTPGTLSYDISPDRKRLTVHFLYRKSEEKMLAEIEEIQQRIKKIIN